MKKIICTTLCLALTSTTILVPQVGFTHIADEFDSKTTDKASAVSYAPPQQSLIEWAQDNPFAAGTFTLFSFSLLGTLREVFRAWRTPGMPPSTEDVAMVDGAGAPGALGGKTLRKDPPNDPGLESDSNDEDGGDRRRKLGKHPNDGSDSSDDEGNPTGGGGRKPLLSGAGAIVPGSKLGVFVARGANTGTPALLVSARRALFGHEDIDAVQEVAEFVMNSHVASVEEGNEAAELNMLCEVAKRLRLRERLDGAGGGAGVEGAIESTMESTMNSANQESDAGNLAAWRNYFSTLDPNRIDNIRLVVHQFGAPQRAADFIQFLQEGLYSSVNGLKYKKRVGRGLMSHQLGVEQGNEFLVHGRCVHGELPYPSLQNGLRQHQERLRDALTNMNLLEYSRRFDGPLHFAEPDSNPSPNRFTEARLREYFTGFPFAEDLLHHIERLPILQAPGADEEAPLEGLLLQAGHPQEYIDIIWSLQNLSVGLQNDAQRLRALEALNSPISIELQRLFQVLLHLKAVELGIVEERGDYAAAAVNAGGEAENEDDGAVHMLGAMPASPENTAGVVTAAAGGGAAAIDMGVEDTDAERADADAERAGESLEEALTEQEVRTSGVGSPGKVRKRRGRNHLR